MLKHKSAGKIDIFIHGCNAQGVMGSGIALQVKQEFPRCFDTYLQHVNAHGKGSPKLVGTVAPFIDHDQHLVIMNAITQLNFGHSGKFVSYRAIWECFSLIKEYVKQLDTDAFDIHYPLIGCDRGGGDWSIVNDIIDTVFYDSPDINRNIWIYELD